MPDFPFIHNYATGRGYYGPSLSDPREASQLWLKGAQRPFYEDAHPTSNLVWAALGAGAVFGAGFIPTGGGRRVWDYYVRGLRGIEEYSPAQLFRTFQLSTAFSRFESVSRRAHFIEPELLRLNRPYAEYIAAQIGPIEIASKRADALGRLTTEGLTVRGGRAYWGQGEELALRFAGFTRIPEGAGAYLNAAYARSLGGHSIRDPSNFFSSKQPLGPKSLARARMVEGMPTTLVGTPVPYSLRKAPRWAQTAGAAALSGWRQASAWGTWGVTRFNRLLEAPAGMEPFKTIFGRVMPWIKKVPGFQHGFAVAEGPGLKMLGALTWKYGAVAGGLALGYQTLDWVARRAEILDETILAEGTTAAAATIWTRANVLASKAADIFGLHAYREAQEEIAPGSTSLAALAAFPAMGGMAAVLASYGLKVGRMARMQLGGATATEARIAVEKTMGAFSGRGFAGRLATALTSPERGLYAREDWVGKVFRTVASKGTTREGTTFLKYAFFGKLGPTKLAGLAGAALGLAATLPFLAGALVPSKRPEELERIYSGEEEVPIRRGRWWEFGRSAWEGQRIMYYRPHWYPRMLAGAREKGVWEEEEPSPLAKWWRREFTYDVEREHYKERPYPVTSLPFEDVPFIGPLLAHTIGKIIKPPLLMHTEEWMGPRGEIVAEQPRFGQRIATEIGEAAGGLPESPYGLKGTVGEQIYRMTEMIGLPGFAAVSLKEKLTGSQDVFDQMKQLESARRIAGFERWYWDMELGGLMGMTEAFRRLYPHRRRQIPLYNPIRNLMPEWLPGPGEKAPDLWHGDPYTKVSEGELRLPGRGYEARYPELEDVRAEDYPLIHKYKILADVGPYTDKFKQYRNMIRAARKRDAWTEYEENIWQVTEEQVAAKKTRLEFQDYKYLSPMGEVFDGGGRWGGEEGSSLIAALNRIHAEQREGEKGGIFDRTFGGYWELLSHNAETAFDQMTPISPAAKFVHTRTPIEHYERTQVYGTESAFWQHPWAHFLRPAGQLLGKSFGFEGIPEHIKQRRGLEQYFDTLEYVKYARLSNLARSTGDTDAFKEFEKKKNQTLFGINPFTRNYGSVFRALPRRDRDYFNAFSEAETAEERQRILELVPENERTLYVARWKMAFADDVKRAEKAGLLSEQEIEEADETVDKIYEEAKAEGFPTSQELFAEYVATRLSGENYGDWYRRTKLLPEVSIPGPDWVGWHPSVDLDDIRLKIVQNLGEDMHDYDMWPSQAQTLVNKPYINTEVISALGQEEGLTADEMRDRINEVLTNTDVRSDIFVRTTHGGDSSVDVDVEQDIDIDKLVKEMTT